VTFSAQRLALPASGRRADSLSKQDSAEAKKTLKKRAESHLSGARFVGGHLGRHDFEPEKDATAELTKLFHVPLLFSISQLSRPDLFRYSVINTPFLFV